MKKKNIITGAFLASLSLMSFACYAATNASKAMSPGETNVSTAVVGVGYHAVGRGLASDVTSGSVTLRVYAAWTGWPFTEEAKTSLAPGDYKELSVTQSLNSVFYTNLRSNGDAAALGRITME